MMNNYIDLTQWQQKRAIYYLSFFHILIITSSNYLVQIPLTIFGVSATWGSLTFPFIFLATDLTVRIFNYSNARRIVFICMFPAIVMSYVVSVLFFQGQWKGIGALLIFDWTIARIAIASFLAYVLGQLTDILAFHQLRKLAKWWLAPLASTVIGNAIDTLVFFFIAFYGSSHEFIATHWIEIAWVDYGFKLFISVLFFVPLYGVLLKYLTKKLIRC